MTGSWLSGPAAAGYRPELTDYRPGERLGLPAAGPGSLAGFGVRLVALLIDGVLTDLIALLFHDLRWNIVILFVEYLVLLSVGGQTVGMRLTRIRVARLDGGWPRPQWVLLRTVLLFVVIPAVITDRDRRGMHDRASGTVVLRT